MDAEAPSSILRDSCIRLTSLRRCAMSCHGKPYTYRVRRRGRGEGEGGAYGGLASHRHQPWKHSTLVWRWSSAMGQAYSGKAQCMRHEAISPHHHLHIHHTTTHIMSHLTY